MGYTHTWGYGPIDTEAWSGLCTDARRIIAEAGVPLADFDGHGAPNLDADAISLNGVGDDSFESFVLNRTGTGWDFCKTGHRPYDLVVSTILLRFALTVESFRLRSDGSWDGDDWEPARTLYAKLFDSAPDESPFRAG